MMTPSPSPSQSRSQFQLTGVPRTMVLTTRARAEEHQRPDSLFRDRYAYEWSQALPWDPELVSFYSANKQAGWAIRANHFDRAVRRHIVTCHQPLVVELGAGLSSRYYRLRQDNLFWVNLDLPEVTAIRRQLDTETECYRFVGASALECDWMEQLPTRSPEDVMIVAEGLMMYFEPNRVADAIAQMRARFPGATFMFDIVGVSYKRTAKKLEALGAPLKWFVGDLEEVTRMGVSLVEARSLFQLHPERWGLLRWFTWLPFIRNMTLILETKLEP